MQHGRAYSFQEEERQEHEQQQGGNGMPGINDRITVQGQIHVEQEIMPQGEQYGQSLQCRVHRHDRESESRDGE